MGLVPRLRRSWSRSNPGRARSALGVRLPRSQGQPDLLRIGAQALEQQRGDLGEVDRAVTQRQTDYRAGRSPPCNVVYNNEVGSRQMVKS